MERTGRIAVYEGPNSPFEIREYPVRDVTAGEVLVRVAMATICRSDLSSYQGKRPSPCPGVLGHEIIGYVEQIGDGIERDLRGDDIRVGDRITWTEFFAAKGSYNKDVLDLPQKGDGLRKYGHDRADLDPHFLGGFGEFCYVLPGTGILKVPEVLSDEEATPLNCGVSTMISVGDTAKICLGDTVVIQGLGLLGLYGCAIAKASGAKLVIGLDVVKERLEIAHEFGADHVFDVSSVDTPQLVASIRELCRPAGADVVIEVCGLAGVIPAGLQMLRVGGRYVLAGMVSPGADVTIDGNALVKNLVTMTGVHNYHPRHLIQATDFVVNNRDRFPFRKIVDSRFSLDELGLAFKKAAERSVLRAAVIP